MVKGGKEYRNHFRCKTRSIRVEGNIFTEMSVSNHNCRNRRRHHRCDQIKKIKK